MEFQASANYDWVSYSIDEAPVRRSDGRQHLLYERQVRSVVASLERQLEGETTATLRRLIDAGEAGIALEVLVETLFDAGASVERAVIANMTELARSMELDGDIFEQLDLLTRSKRPD